MFHQFRVNTEHRKYWRFLWLNDGDVGSDLTEYRMIVHLFRAVSAPGCDNVVQKQAATDGAAPFGSDVANFIFM